MDDLKARAQQELDFTIECSGNHGLPFLVGAIGNARWTGAPLAALLEEAGVQEDGIEVVFFGSDVGEVEVREIPMTPNFARSMSLEDAMSPHNLLAFEMNGEPLPQSQRLSRKTHRAGLVRHRQCQVAQAHRGAAQPLHGSLHGA